MGKKSGPNVSVDAVTHQEHVNSDLGNSEHEASPDASAVKKDEPAKPGMGMGNFFVGSASILLDAR